METFAPHVRAAEKRRVPANTQLWLKVVVKSQELAVILQDARLYERRSLIGTNRVVELQRDKHFFLLVETF